MSIDTIEATHEALRRLGHPVEPKENRPAEPPPAQEADFADETEIRLSLVDGKLRLSIGGRPRAVTPSTNLRAARLMVGDALGLDPDGEQARTLGLAFIRTELFDRLMGEEEITRGQVQAWCAGKT